MGISFSTTDDRLEKIDGYIQKGAFPDRSSLINSSIDFYLDHLQSKYVQDFMYMIGLPFFLFLVMLGFTLYFQTVYFFVLTGMSGVYFMVFIFLFYNKYRGVKVVHNRK